MRYSPALFTLAAIATAVIPVVNSEPARGQTPSSTLDQTGQITYEGRVTPYRIRNLPVSSFPELPPAIATALTSRGCVIPQTFEAKQPENVIRGSFERPGSNDWAALCQVKNDVSILVFFADASPDLPITLDTVACLRRLAPHGGELGFDWGIDPASPHRVHDAQASMSHRPPPPDHDAVAETTIDRGKIYHLYENGAWQTVSTE
jgi:hypothetical protein